MAPFTWIVGALSLVPERLDDVEAGRAPRGQYRGDDARGRRDEREDDERRHRCGAGSA
jgi:hypothetical protein